MTRAMRTLQHAAWPAMKLSRRAGDAASQAPERASLSTWLREPRTACRRPRHGCKPNLPCVQQERCKVKKKTVTERSGVVLFGFREVKEALAAD